MLPPDKGRINWEIKNLIKNSFFKKDKLLLLKIYSFNYKTKPMTIPENVKMVGLIALIGGVGTLIFRAATQNDRLREAIEDIRKAQTLIKSSIDTIEIAKTGIKDVQFELKSLKSIAEASQTKLETLREERQQFEKSIKETVLNSREVMRNQKQLVDEFQKLKKERDAQVDSIKPLVILPLPQKN